MVLRSYSNNNIICAYMMYYCSTSNYAYVEIEAMI